MTAAALQAPTNIRTYSATIAQCLAVALAVAIPIGNAVTTTISIFLAVSCIMYMNRNIWSQVLKHPITIAILIFIALSILDLTFTIASYSGITLALRKTIRLLYFPLLLPIFAQIKLRHMACMGFLAAVFVSVVVAIYYHTVIFKDTIYTSLFVAFAIFMLVHYSYDYKKYRGLSIALAIFFTFYLLFMGSGRIGQFLFIMLSLLFIRQRVGRTFKQQALAVLILALIIAASLLAPSSFLLRNTAALLEVKQYIEIDEADIPYGSSMGTRLILARNSWEIIKQSPILGWGTGSFPAAYKKYAPEMQIKQLRRVNPHNQYLLTWVELGVPGLISLLFLFFTATWLFFKSKELWGYLGLGLVASVMVGCCLNSWLLDYTSTFFFLFFAAVFAGAGYSNGDEYIASPARNQ